MFTLTYNDIINFNQQKLYNQATELCHMMLRNRSDKGLSRHNYTTFYDMLFSKNRQEKLNVFELGMGSADPTIPFYMPGGRVGASHYGWSEYFPNANVYGADIDRKTIVDDKAHRVKSYYCDQTNPAVIADMWANNDLKDLSFDIILEDGLHEVNANKLFLRQSMHKLKDGGVYIIEDIPFSQFAQYSDLLMECKAKYKFAELVTIQGRDPVTVYDNALFVVIK